MYTINIVSYYIDLFITWFTQYITMIWDKFMEFSFIIKIAAISVTTSIILILLMLGRIFIKGWQNRRYKKLDKKLDKRFGDGIRYVLSPEAGGNMTRSEVLYALDIDNPDDHQNEIPKHFKEKLVLSRLIYRSRISDDASLGRRKNLHIMLDIFHIKSFLEDVINKGNMQLKAEALNMLRAFKLPINQWVANQLHNSKRLRVKRLAMYASIMTSTNADMGYFESNFFDRNCCIYDEIQLGYVLQRRIAMKRKLPNLAQLAIMQSVPSTKAVFVRLMHQFRQEEHCAELEEEFRNTHDRELRKEICRTWGYLGYKEAEPLMQEIILSQSDDVKISIFHAVTRLNTGKSLEMLTDGYRNNSDQLVKYEALKSLFNYGPAGKARFHELEKAAPEADRRLFEFFTNSITMDETKLNRTEVFDMGDGKNLYAVN